MASSAVSRWKESVKELCRLSKYDPAILDPRFDAAVAQAVDAVPTPHTMPSAPRSTWLKLVDELQVRIDQGQGFLPPKSATQGSIGVELSLHTRHPCRYPARSAQHLQRWDGTPRAAPLGQQQQRCGSL